MASKGPSEGNYKRSSFQSSQTMTQTPKPASASTTVRVSSAAPSSTTHDQIAARAKAIWQANGCPSGQDEKNWLEAERQLRAEMKSR